MHVSVPPFQENPAPEHHEEFTVRVVAQTLGAAPIEGSAKNETTKRPRITIADVFFFMNKTRFSNRRKAGII